MGVFSEIKPKNLARKNPFDLSCYCTYNTKCGLALPLKFWPTLPSSEYELDLKCLLRTQPLATAAFAGFSINYDVVWTPNNDHYSSFNQFIAQRLNKQHTTQPDISNIPHFDLGSFVEVVLSGAVYDSFAADITFIEWQRLVEREIGVPRFIAQSVNLKEESMFLTALRTLDLLEYGNYLPALKHLKNEIATFLDDTVHYTVEADKKLPYVVRLAAFSNGLIHYDEVLTPHQWVCENLDEFKHEGGITALIAPIWNMCFYHSSPINNLMGFFRHNEYYSLWPIMCYNKAFWQFYRNEYYDIDYEFLIPDDGPFTTKETVPYVNLFNYDDFVSALHPVATDLESYKRLLAMFAVKPHQYKKDLFTGILPSTQYGSVSVASTDDVFAKLIGNFASSSFTSPLSAGQVVTATGSSSDYDSGSKYVVLGKSDYASANLTSDKFKFDPAPMINVLELRRADAMQRFKERMLRAGNKTKDIFVAHGWDEPLSEKAFDVQFFGNFDGRLDLNVVASTTDTENVNLGQLAANGVGIVNGSKVRFKCNDFGTLMVIAYITKDAVYDSYGVHKSHAMLESFDFPYPELQNVSLAPIVENQLNNYGTSKNTSVLGYEPQNMAYKTQSDLVHGEFFSSPIFTPATLAEPNTKSVVGIFANMVTPRQDIMACKTLSFLYIQPSCADNIFVQNATSNQDSDQFFGNVRFDLKAVQPLDVIGLPI